MISFLNKASFNPKRKVNQIITKSFVMDVARLNSFNQIKYCGRAPKVLETFVKGNKILSNPILKRRRKSNKIQSLFGKEVHDLT